MDGPDTPTHLVFVSLNSDGSLRQAWKYKWQWLKDNDRLKTHVVRGEPRSRVFFVNPANDGEFVLTQEREREIAEDNEESGTSRLWSDDPLWIRGVEDYARSRESGIKELKIDLEWLDTSIFSSDIAYRLMSAMQSIAEHEGMEGFRGAPRVVKAFLHLLAEASKNHDNA